MISWKIAVKIKELLVRKFLNLFSNVNYIDIDKEYYITPIATK